MYVPLQLYHYDLFILMWSLFLRVLFLEVIFHMVMWRGAPHTYQVCVWSRYVCVEPLSVSVCWSKRVRSKSRTNCVHVYYRSIYARQARGIWPMLVQCWAASYRWPAGIDPALVWCFEFCWVACIILHYF